jgi:hypothetical protein
MVAMNRLKIETINTPMNALDVEFMRDPDKCKSRKEADGYTRIILPDGRRVTVSDRFWISWCSLQNQGRSVFDLFSHSEVFSRIVRERGDNVRLAFEVDRQDDIGGKVVDGRLLSCTNPKKPLLPIDAAQEIVDKYEGQDINYADGVINATFDCPFPTPYNIAGEDYKTQFTLQMPIDGYGMPQTYLTLLRLICANGMIGMAKAFKTSFQLGRGESNIAEVLDRAMTTFSAEEGFHSFRVRMESAAKSWASLGEAAALCKTMSVSMHEDKVPVKERVNILEKFDALCGDPLKYYGLTGRQELSPRRARTVPVKSTIYELMTFASEVATHKLNGVKPKNRINSWIGTAVSSEYDLEGTVEEFGEWKDFFVN